MGFKWYCTICGKERGTCKHSEGEEASRDETDYCVLCGGKWDLNGECSCRRALDN